MGLKVEAQKDANNDYVKHVRRMCRIVIDRASALFKRYDALYKFSLDYHIEKRTVEKIHQVTKSVIRNRQKDLCSNNSKLNNDTIPLSENQLEKNHINFIDILLKCTDDNGKTMGLNEIREEVDTIMFEVRLNCNQSYRIQDNCLHSIMKIYH